MARRAELNAQRRRRFRSQAHTACLTDVSQVFALYDMTRSLLRLNVSLH